MDVKRFYDRLLSPVVAEVGPIDPDTIVAIIGFDAGGPLSICTVGREAGEEFVTYVTCELALRPEQQPSEVGGYELMLTCDDEEWACNLLTAVGRMSFELAFGDGHTLDIGSWVDPAYPIQGIAFELFSSSRIDGGEYGLFRLHGLSRDDLEQAQRTGVASILARRRSDRLYPRTSVRRPTGRCSGPAPRLRSDAGR